MTPRAAADTTKPDTTNDTGKGSWSKLAENRTARWGAAAAVVAVGALYARGRRDTGAAASRAVTTDAETANTAGYRAVNGWTVGDQGAQYATNAATGSRANGQSIAENGATFTPATPVARELVFDDFISTPMSVPTLGRSRAATQVLDPAGLATVADGWNTAEWGPAPTAP